MTPTLDGPQLSDADLTAMLTDDFERLATMVRIDLAAAESLFADNAITREELRWVQSDAERVRNEVIRREGISTNRRDS